jgi:hypothetical protein
LWIVKCIYIFNATALNFAQLFVDAQAKAKRLTGLNSVTGLIK